MKKKNPAFTLAALLLLLLPARVLKGEGKFSGLMFGDYYYVLKNHDAPASGEKPQADLYTYLTLFWKF